MVSVPSFNNKDVRIMLEKLLSASITQKAIIPITQNKTRINDAISNCFIFPLNITRAVFFEVLVEERLVLLDVCMYWNSNNKIKIFVRY